MKNIFWKVPRISRKDPGDSFFYTRSPNKIFESRVHHMDLALEKNENNCQKNLEKYSGKPKDG